MPDCEKMQGLARSPALVQGLAELADEYRHCEHINFSRLVTR